MKFPSPEKIRNGVSILLIAAFLALIWLPTLDSFFGLDKAPTPNEKRAPAKFPEFNASVEGIRQFLAGLEAYYSDHFGFRKRLIRWEHRWKRGLFKESTLSDVMIGRDGWLFYAGDNMIDHARATKSYTPDQLAAWKELLEGRRDWCAKRGIKYIFAVPPDKHSIYPEYLPEWMTRVGNQTKYDQFVAYMKAHSNVPVVDLRPALLEAKKTQRTYLFTDTHWNWYGGFIAYQTVIKNLSAQMPELKPLTVDAFEQKFRQEPGGDLAGMLGQEQSMPEKDYVLLEPKPPLQPLKIITETNLLGKKWVKGGEPMITENPHATGKAILFRDSFAGGWVPYLGYHFNKVIYLWQYNWDKAFIEKEKPEVIIDEMLERFLNRENPRELKEKDEQANATVASHQ